MSASQTLDYEHPYSLAPGAVPRACARGGTTGFGARRLAGGGGRSRHPSTAWRAAFALVGLRTRGTCSFPRGRCGRPLTRLSLLPLGFRWACPRLRVGPPGRELPRIDVRRHVTGGGARRSVERLLPTGAISRRRSSRFTPVRAPPCRESRLRSTLMRGGSALTGLGSPPGWQPPHPT
jgi:hypothetical protein